MTVADNAISLRLLEDLCADLRVRMAVQAKAERRQPVIVSRTRIVATRMANVLAILISACLFLAEI